MGSRATLRVPSFGPTRGCLPVPPSSRPSLQDQQRRLQQPLPPFAGRGAQVRLSHQLLLGQRRQNLRLQLHGQPGNGLRGRVRPAIRVPPAVCVPPAAVSPCPSPSAVSGCWCLGNTSLLWHFPACTTRSYLGVPRGAGTLWLWNDPLSVPSVPHTMVGLGLRLLQVRTQSVLGLLGQGQHGDQCPWQSSLGAEPSGVLPPHSKTPSEPCFSVTVCLQERQVHPFLVEMRHRGRLRGPFGRAGGLP